MKSFRVLGHQAKYIGAAFVMLVATFTPLVVTQAASAAQLTSRSVALSTSSKAQTGVSYAFTFTSSAATTDAGVLIEFCSNSPLIGEACTAPGNSFSVSGGNVTGGTKVGTWTANRAEVEKTLAASANTFTITGVANPTVAGTIYARVVTYGSAGAISTNTTETPSTHIDEGSVAISITDTIGVSGSVLESMTFCVAAVVITADCANAAANPPTLALGEDVGNTVALQAGTISTGNLHTQLTTNASGGAVVSLRSSTTGCGGLVRVGASNCDIAPALTGGDISVGDSKFGVKTAAAATNASGAASPGGTLQAAGAYNDATYEMNYVSGDASGITGPYGDPFLNSAGAPVNNKNMQLTFGATINNNTPAGRYSADISLIATGTF